MTAATIPRAIVYVRLSVYAGADDPSTSPEGQEARCRAYCAAQGWDVVEVIRDLDVSGSARGARLNRPGIRRIREVLADHGAEHVVFARLDRLARSVADFHAIAEMAKTYGAALASVKEGLDLSTPYGRFFATTIASFAELEADVIASRVADANVEMRKAGRFFGSVPYGYQTAPHPSGKGLTLVPHEGEAAVVREFARRAIDGESLASIARDFNERRIPKAASKTTKPGRSGTPEWSPWRVSTLAKWVRSDTLAGYQLHKGEPVRGADGLPVMAWQPVLDGDTVRALRAAVDAGPKHADGRPKARVLPRLLTGWLYCASCNRPMRPQRFAAGPAYRCISRMSGLTCDGSTSINCDAVEEYVTDRFLGAFGRQPAWREVEGTDPEAVERAGLARRELASLGTEMARPDADMDALLQRRTLILEALTEADAAAARTGTRLEPTGRTFADEWHSGSLAWRREMLGQWLDHATVRRSPTRNHRTPLDERVDIVTRHDDYLAGQID
jgi:site-specific DNA recombinase